MRKFSYKDEELFSMNQKRILKGDAKEAAFLLGGIGTGNVSIGARGELRDWEIFNSPGKGNYLPYTFFALWAKSKKTKPIIKILESKIHPPYSKSHGFLSEELAGLPRIESSLMQGEYPFVWVTFKDKTVPLNIKLEAFTPFIPLNIDDSCIPGAIIRYKIKNNSNDIFHITIIGSLANVVGFNGYRNYQIQLIDEGKNVYKEHGNIKGLYFEGTRLSPNHLKYGNMSIMTGAKRITYKTSWLEGGWWDGIQDFWDDFSNDGILEKDSFFDAPGNRMEELKVKIGSLGIVKKLKPGEEQIFQFIITWYFPNRIAGWDEGHSIVSDTCKVAKNYYSKLFSDSWDAGSYLFKNMDRLEDNSRKFQYALFSSTLPSYVIEAVANNITVIRSPTCFLLQDGTFLSWEGCYNNKGSCEGNCTHVWNYAQTLAFLFPKLEQSMRLIEFNLETDDHGNMAFRTHQIFGQKKYALQPAADGQLGCIIKLYRDWKLSGDDDFLKKLWGKASKVLDFAFDYWDSDGDFILDKEQHNTYDIELYGPNSFINSVFYAALKAGIEMATYLGDKEHAEKYQEAFDKGSKKMDRILWNGEYYVQKLFDVNKYRYQFGNGCLSDQLFGQLLAHLMGLGYLFPEEHVKKALQSIFKYNYKISLKNQHNVQRTFAINDEKGLLVCTWPKGGKPKLPLVYATEVFTGIEYQVAAHLIYEGFIKEGLTLVKSVRDRFDGYKRNPWNEIECGSHYVRSMASWSLLIALSGFKYDMVKHIMSFKPVINVNNFSTFWSTGKAWGIYTQKQQRNGKVIKNVKPLYGNVDDVKINYK